MRSLHEIVEDIWYARHPLALLLAPLSLVFRGGVALRRLAFRSGLLGVYDAEVPVIVVGNIIVGGTGKTPLVIWLARYLRGKGYRPGIVARGYGGNAQRWPQQVRSDSDPVAVGDEAVVLARRTACPVAVGPERAEAIESLLYYNECDVVISDDGLQHYAIKRALEIAVLDGVRRAGNGLCLPAGPLREPVSRLESVDLVVSNGVPGRGEFPMSYRADWAVSLKEPARRVALDDFEPKDVHLVAGIGNAERFFRAMRSRGLRGATHAFADHHDFSAEDLGFGDGLPVVMTEKDAVKCEPFARDDFWYVPITAELPEVFATRLDLLLEKLANG